MRDVDVAVRHGAVVRKGNQLADVMSMERERRAFASELRAKGRRLEGYAATFNAETRIGDFMETHCARSVSPNACQQQ